MSHILNIKINDSAFKKLKNMMYRKGYPNFGDLIAYLIREENKRTLGDRAVKQYQKSSGSHLPAASPSFSNNKMKQTTNKDETNEI